MPDEPEVEVMEFPSMPFNKNQGLFLFGVGGMMFCFVAVATPGVPAGVVITSILAATLPFAAIVFRLLGD